MSAEPQQAKTIEEGGAVNLERYEWAYLGEAPATAEEAGYQAYDEPPAETDNDWNHGDQLNDELLNWKMGELESELDTLRSDLQNLRDDFNAHNHDSRYYRKTQTEDLYVNETGDTMTGSLRVQDHVRIDEQLFVERNGGGVNVAATDTGERPYIAPIVNGDEKYGDEITYVNGEWDIEGTPKAGGQTIATHNWVDDTQVSQSGDTMEGILDHGGHIVDGVGGTVRFSSVGGDGLDFTPNSDGAHYLWKHTDGTTNPTEYAAHLNSGSGEVWGIGNEDSGMDYLSVDLLGNVSVKDPDSDKNLALKIGGPFPSILLDDSDATGLMSTARLTANGQQLWLGNDGAGEASSGQVMGIEFDGVQNEIWLWKGGSRHKRIDT